jgi:hypothetical protein
MACASRASSSNVFDDDSWAACARWTDFDSAPTIGQLTTFQGVAVSPQTPRQYGHARQHQVLRLKPGQATARGR